MPFNVAAVEKGTAFYRNYKPVARRETGTCRSVTVSGAAIQDSGIKIALGRFSSLASDYSFDKKVLLVFLKIAV